MSQLNQSNVDDATLLGVARWQAFYRKWLAKWNAPQADADLVQVWDALDPATRQAAQQMNPEAYRIVSERMEGRRHAGQVQRNRT